MNKKTAKRLEALRKEKGYTQAEIASQLGVSRQAVSKWESGESSPDTDNLMALAKLYRVSIDELIDADIKSTKRLEEEREDYFNMGEKKEKKHPTSKAASFPFPVLVVAAFLFIGFVLNVWHPTWLIFLTIPLYYYIVSWIDNARYNENKPFMELFPYPLLVALAFVLIGIFTGVWHPTWLLFLTIPIYYIILGIVKGDSDAIHAWYPIFITLAYLFLGFFFGLWHPTWLLFLTIPIYYMLVGKKKNAHGILHGILPIIVAGVYLVLGFFYGLWHPGWLIFLTIPLWSWFIEAMGRDRKKDDTFGE